MADDENSNVARRNDIMTALRADRKWYVRRKLQLQSLWLVLTSVSLIPGFLTSILIAIDWPAQSDKVGKALLVSLPAIATFCGTLLVHFRLRENWELRELGRIDIEELLVRARFLPLSDSVLFETELRAIYTERINLSRQQTTKFFSILIEKQPTTIPKTERTADQSQKAA